MPPAAILDVGGTLVDAPEPDLIVAALQKAGGGDAVIADLRERRDETPLGG